jgi:tubulin polyglutamylase TTLL6/13
MYADGLGRFATEEYVNPSSGGCQNLFVHLTNYAINKNSEKFTADNEAQFKRSLKDIYEVSADYLNNYLVSGQCGPRH